MKLDFLGEGRKGLIESDKRLLSSLDELHDEIEKSSELPFMHARVGEWIVEQQARMSIMQAEEDRSRKEHIRQKWFSVISLFVGVMIMLSFAFMGSWVATLWAVPLAMGIYLLKNHQGMQKRSEWMIKEYEKREQRLYKLSTRIPSAGGMN